jgi:hypothetical protein
MRIASSRLPAVVCVLTLPLAALAIRPVVEMGLCDDWSYIRTAQILAQTGHIVYNGWASPLLGWQLFLGALFVKLFGFSFTIVRASIFPVAMAVVFLLQRSMVRAGIREWNAALGTLAVVLSPLFLPLTFSFMTDIAGLFGIVLCLYACLRALQADTDRAALAWICFAAISNTIFGTARQLAWLGVLVMVPSTLWLLRRRPHFLLAGSILYLGCVAFIFASVHWFHQQPYSVPENPFFEHVSSHTLISFGRNMVHAIMDAGLFVLPILVIFIPELRRGNRRSTIFFVIGSSVFVLFCLIQVYRHWLMYWLTPYLGNYITVYGLMEDGAVHGRKIVLSLGLRLVVTALIFASMLSFFAFLLAGRKKPDPPFDPAPQLSWYQLNIVIVPFTLAYIGLLLPRAAFSGYLFFDRYLLVITPMALILILRFYQERVRPNVPVFALVPIALFAAFGIAGTHDIFSLYRARLAVVNELRAAGVPPTEIDAGFEYDGWTQINLARFVNDPQIPIQPGDHFTPPNTSIRQCRPYFLNDFPVLSPHYGLSLDPEECQGPAEFPPVTTRTWLGPRFTTIYVVHVGNEEESTISTTSRRYP